MATYTNDAPKEHAGARAVSAVEVAESLSEAQQAAEIPSALGIPVDVSGVSVPVPGLVALAVLEQIDSPFMGGGADLDTLDTLRALYIVSEPRAAMRAVAPAIRAIAALDGLSESARENSDSWERYVELKPSLLSEAWSKFDDAVSEYAESLGAVPGIDLAQALAEQIALACRGYEMIPSDDDAKKKAGESESST